MAFDGKDPAKESMIFADKGVGAVDNAPTGKIRVINRDGSLFLVDDTGSEKAIGTGAGGTNYIVNPDAEINETDGVTASNVTLGEETSTPLAGDRSFLITNQASIAGTCDWDITISDEYVTAGGINLLVTGIFRISNHSSGADGDYTVGIYKTSGTPGYVDVQTDLINDSDNYYESSFAPLAGETYKIRLEWTDSGRASTDATATVDKLKVTPDSNAGTAVLITPWKAITPGSSGFTVGTNRIEWRQVGDSVEYRGRYTQSSSAATEWQLDLPNGYTVRNPDSGTFFICGKLIRSVTSTVNYNYSVLATHGDTFLNVGFRDGTSSIQPFDPINADAVGNNDVSFFASVPVQELQNSKIHLINQNMVAANAKARWNSSGGSGLAIGARWPYTTEVYNIGGFENSGGEITFPADGYYRIQAFGSFISNSASGTGIRMDGSLLSPSINGKGSGGSGDGRSLDLIYEGYFTKGETVEFVSDGPGTTPSRNPGYLLFSRLSDFGAVTPVGFATATDTNLGLIKMEIRDFSSSGTTMTSSQSPTFTNKNCFVKVYEAAGGQLYADLSVSFRISAIGGSPDQTLRINFTDLDNYVKPVTGAVGIHYIQGQSDEISSNTAERNAVWESGGDLGLNNIPPFTGIISPPTDRRYVFNWINVPVVLQ